MNTKQNTPINIPKLIASYARVYKKFENVQDDETSPLQNSAGKEYKTGVIGEYYAYMYLKHQGLKPEYAGAGKPWDIIAKSKKSERKYRYQVKTVSGYSNYESLSPIRSVYKGGKGWHVLIVIQLDTSFKPIEFLEIPLRVFKNRYKATVSNINLKGSFVERYKKYSQLDKLKKVPQLEL